MHLLSVALLFLLCKVGIALFAVDHLSFAVVKLLCVVDINTYLTTSRYAMGSNFQIFHFIPKNEFWRLISYWMGYMWVAVSPINWSNNSFIIAL